MEDVQILLERHEQKIKTLERDVLEFIQIMARLSADIEFDTY